MAKNKFPPTVAEIAAQPKEKSAHFDNVRQWEREAAQARKSGNTKTFLDYLPPNLRKKYSTLMSREDE